MRPPEIRAEATEYVHTVTGQRWWRVTSICDRVLQTLAGIPPEHLEAGRARGTYVHDAIHLINGGRDQTGLDRTSVPPAYLPYLWAFDNFATRTKRKLLASEEWIAHPTMPVAGTADEISELQWKDKPTRQIVTFVDYKTGQAAAWHAAQLSAYAESWRAREKYRGEIRRMTVYLGADGRPSVTAWTDPLDWPSFTGFVQTYAWHARKGTLCTPRSAPPWTA